MNDPQQRAKELVEDFIYDHHEKTDPELGDFAVYIVWFCYTLGSWKALLSSTLPDGKYYEVTHNKEKSETYVDVYVKVRNVAYPDLAP